MTFNVGDYVKFSFKEEDVPERPDEQGRTLAAIKKPVQTYIGRVSRNPAVGWLQGQAKELAGLIEVTYMQGPAGQNAIVLLTEKDLTAVPL